MKKILVILVCFCTITLTSCSDYGKKVKINDNTEVYIKGKDVTEGDAKKLGDYIASTYKEQTNQKSFQLSKDNGQYVVKMVVDEEKVKTDSSLDVSFMALQFLFETQVFAGSKVKLVLTDNQFRDIKTFPSTAAPAEQKAP